MVIENNIPPLPQGERELVVAVLINAAPTHQSAHTAYHFTKAALAKGHRVPRIFFYQDGVLHGNQLITPPQDELNLVTAWQKLKYEYPIELTLCIAAALRRGILDATEAERHDKQHGNLATGFTLSGLGQLMEAIIHCDRFIQFG